MRISRGWTDRASGAASGAGLLALASVLAAACGGGSSGVEGPAPAPVPRELAADQVFSVEVWGAQASDTVVTFLASQARTIVLRHGPPDNTVFAEVDVPMGALTAPRGTDSVTLTIRPLPGIYGLVLESDASVTTPIRLTFKYPVHFAAPSDSRARYPSDVLFEQALVVALAQNDGTTFQTLRTIRPASDNLQVVLSVLGRYQMVAPR